MTSRTTSLGLAVALVAAVAVLGAGEAQAPKSTTKPATPAPAAAHTGHEGHDMSAMKPAKPKPQGERKTITGEVMDPACFLEAGPKSIGTGHFQCAVDCVRSGQTLAIYDRDADRIYFVAGELPGRNPNEPLLPYIHKKVDVTGVVYHRSDAYGIVISKVTPHEDKGGASPAPAAGTTR
ncbi:MAG TPA: hypothetical protein VFR25_10135 [Candidatus Eisenbacteria bacterium]|nr:hypothetical protein [Candidatus Eisenbacteria bacterium]